MNTKQQVATHTTRQQILQAALEVTQRVGMSQFTLDAVAQQADISKGGLMHHYPSKNALIEALVQQLLAEFSERVTGYYEQEAEGRGRWLRAYVRASFAPEPRLRDVRTVLAMVVDYPAILQRLQKDAEEWAVRLMDEGLSAARVSIIQRAADAQWIESLLDVQTDNAEAIERELFALIAGGQ